MSPKYIPKGIQQYQEEQANRFLDELYREYDKMKLREDNSSANSLKASINRIEMAGEQNV